MKETTYLSTDEQFKEVLNNEEIDRIRDPELRIIRRKYWDKRSQAFLNETDIPDQMLESVFQELDKAEKEELASYRQKHGI